MCHFRLKNITDNTYEIKHSVYWIYIRLPGASNLIQNSVFTNVALNIKAAFAMEPLSVEYIKRMEKSVFNNIVCL